MEPPLRDLGVPPADQKMADEIPDFRVPEEISMLADLISVGVTHPYFVISAVSVLCAATVWLSTG